MVRSVILRCYNCWRYQSGPFKMPNMLSWPLKKVIRSSPFTYSGLDYIGPMYIKEESRTKKVWIALFTCIAVRAVHLEVVSDMSVEGFLLALRRFISLLK